MANMGKEIASFISMAESEGEDRLRTAHGLFRLLLSSSKEMLLSAVREANALHVHKLRYVESLLGMNLYELWFSSCDLVSITRE